MKKRKRQRLVVWLMFNIRFVFQHSEKKFLVESNQE